MFIMPACGPESDSLSTRSGDMGSGAGGTGSTATTDDWGTNWDPGRDRGSADSTAGASTIWTIVLATFPSEAGARAAADNMMRQLQTLAPQLDELWVHSAGSGSMVVSGRYDSVENPDAQAALHRIKAVEIQGQPAFARAMLTRVKVRPVGLATHPLSLMSVRLRYPNLDPLYTLEVGIWGDFESGLLTLKQIHEKAEMQTRELRNRGFEAYFYHDNDKRLSVVSVGVFDRTAIDARSGMYGPALQSLMDQFPAHLVNGETLLEPIDGRDASRGTRVQKPMPVLIPKR
jgi:hypothetical protein